MSPNQLKYLIQKLQENIPAINISIPVITDSQLAVFLSNIRKEDNLILVGVLPNYGTEGKNVDSYQGTTAAELMILKKIDQSSIPQNMIFDVYQECYEVWELIRAYLAELAANEDGDCNVSFLKNLDINSLSADAVTNLGSCNGYSIDFDL